jgi:hypothetical protein
LSPAASVRRSDSHGYDLSAAIVVWMLVAAQAWKTLWLVTVLGRWEARSATEVTVEQPDTKSRNQGAKIPDERAGFYRAEEWGREGYL